jgi:hypothetical protein
VFRLYIVLVQENCGLSTSPKSYLVDYSYNGSAGIQYSHYQRRVVIDREKNEYDIAIKDAKISRLIPWGGFKKNKAAKLSMQKVAT